MWCGLERVVHCVGDGWISIAAHVWTEWIPFVDLFLSFYLCSVFSPELISCTPSLPLLQPFFFHSCNNTSVTLASFFLSLSPILSPFLFISFPLECGVVGTGMLEAQSGCCRRKEGEERQLGITCWLDSKRYDYASSKQLQHKPAYISKHPDLHICLCAQKLLSWGISSAMNEGLFQTLPNVLFNSAGLPWVWDGRQQTDKMDGCGHNCGSRRSLDKNDDQKSAASKYCIQSEVRSLYLGCCKSVV